MVSRRKILSRSRDELHSDIYFMNEDDDEDIWYSKDKLYRVSQHIYLFSNVPKSQISIRYPLWSVYSVAVQYTHGY